MGKTEPSRRFAADCGTAEGRVAGELPVPAAAGPWKERNLQELMVQVAGGDEEAFARVYDAIAGPVYGLVFTVLRDRAQSEEVVQEVMAEVWRSATRFRPERGGAKTWVMTLAHSRAVDRVRSNRAAEGREYRSVVSGRTPAFDEVSERVVARLEGEEVRRCLATLTELQRQAVTLVYYRGFTCREAADSLSVPLGTVKTRLRDGLIRLRDGMGEAT